MEFGAGKWDGQNLEWYPKFQQVFKINSQPHIRFQLENDTYKAVITSDLILDDWTWNR